MTAGTTPGRPDICYDATPALGQGRPALIWRKLIADTETPVGAAVKLIVPGRGDYLLESVEGGAVRGRYSMLGLDPDLVFRATGHACEINRQWRSQRDTFEPLAGDSLAELRALVEGCRIEVPDNMPPIACLVG
jgi:anthranilate synthase component 1